MVNTEETDDAISTIETSRNYFEEAFIKMQESILKEVDAAIEELESRRDLIALERLKWLQYELREDLRITKEGGNYGQK